MSDSNESSLKDHKSSNEQQPQQQGMTEAASLHLEMSSNSSEIRSSIASLPNQQDNSSNLQTKLTFVEPAAGTPAAVALEANKNVKVSKFSRGMHKLRTMKRPKMKSLNLVKRINKTTKKKRKKKHFSKNFKGKVIDGVHELYTLTAGMMLGIRYTVHRAANSSDSQRGLMLSDFTYNEKVPFPPGGCDTLPHITPAHSLAHTFKFKSYAPRIFHRLREFYEIDAPSYMDSVCGDYNFIEFISNSKSGQFFFYSHDGHYMLKTQTKEENKFMLRILPKYFKYLTDNPNSLLVRILGMHRLKMYHLRRKVHFVVMTSVFDTPIPINTIYDLKGSLVGRSATQKERDSGGVLKDNDLIADNRKLHFGEKKAAFMEQLRKDAAFLAEMNIMDYSLLVGIHDRNSRPQAVPSPVVHAPGSPGKPTGILQTPNRRNNPVGVRFGPDVAIPLPVPPPATVFGDSINKHSDTGHHPMLQRQHSNTPFRRSSIGEPQHSGRTTEVLTDDDGEDHGNRSNKPVVFGQKIRRNSAPVNSVGSLNSARPRRVSMSTSTSPQRNEIYEAIRTADTDKSLPKGAVDVRDDESLRLPEGVRNVSDGSNAYSAISTTGSYSPVPISRRVLDTGEMMNSHRTDHSASSSEAGDNDSDDDSNFDPNHCALALMEDDDDLYSYEEEDEDDEFYHIDDGDSDLDDSRTRSNEEEESVGQITPQRRNSANSETDRASQIVVNYDGQGLQAAEGQALNEVLNEDENASRDQSQSQSEALNNRSSLSKLISGAFSVQRSNTMSTNSSAVRGRVTSYQSSMTSSSNMTESGIKPADDVPIEITYGPGVARRHPWTTRRDEGINSRIGSVGHRRGNEIYYLGIIDILQQYNMNKRVETYAKSLTNDRKQISSVSAKEYADRFIAFMEDNIE